MSYIGVVFLALLLIISRNLLRKVHGRVFDAMML